MSEVKTEAGTVATVEPDVDREMIEANCRAYDNMN